MWYEKKNMWPLLLIGTFVSLIGALLAFMGHGLLGTLVFAVGISAVVISSSVLKFHSKFQLATSINSADHEISDKK